MTPDQKALLIAQIGEWHNHPVTKLVLTVLKNHESDLGEIVTTSAMNKDLDAEHCRRLATQLGTVKTINKLLYAPGNIADNADRISSNASKRSD